MITGLSCGTWLLILLFGLIVYVVASPHKLLDWSMWLDRKARELQDLADRLEERSHDE